MSIRDVTRLGVRLRSLMGRGRKQASSQPDGVLLGYDESGREVRWPRPTVETASHMTCLGTTSAGKTVMLDNAVASEAITYGNEICHVIVDPKGDCCHGILNQIAASAPERLADVRILDPFDPAGGFPFNLCRLPLGATPVDIRALQLAGLASAVSTATGGQSHLTAGPRQLDAAMHVCLGALSTNHPKANVLWALDALTQKNGMRMLASLTTSARANEFLTSTKLSEELRVSTASRLRAAFGATDHLEHLISADGCIDFADLTAPGRITLIDVGRPTGGLLSLQQFYLNLIVRLLIDHLLERPSPWRGHHVRLVIDEVQLAAPVLADLAEMLLTTGRSRGLSLVAISQGTCLIRDASETLLRVLMGNSPTRLIGRLAAPDAELLARELAPKTGVDETVSSVRTRFVSTVTNLPNRHFIKLTAGESVRFVSADVDMAAREEAAGRHADAIENARHAFRVSDSGPRTTLAQAANASTSRSGRGGRREEEPIVIEREAAPEPDSRPDDGVDTPPPSGPPPRSRWG